MPSNAFQFSPADASAFSRKVARISGQNIQECYQCRRCTAGCPAVQDEGDFSPDMLIRLVNLGDKNAAINNEMVWKCVTCYTCGTRCPNNIHISRVADTLKKMVKESGVEPLKPNIAYFHSSFLGSGVRWGRVNEGEFMGVYEMKNILHLAKQRKFKEIYDEILQLSQFVLRVLKQGRMHFGFLTSKGHKEIKRLKRQHQTSSKV